MARIILDCFPGGRHKALTMSYDDGVVQDRRLAAIFNQHGIRGTFHLNSGLLNTKGRIDAAEVAELYRGHEVSVHGVRHHYPTRLDRESLIAELYEDRRALERLVGYPVRGMSYAYGDYDDRVVAQLPALGIEYARTTRLDPGYGLPADFLRWTPTCHHRDCLARGKEFLSAPDRQGPRLLYVWGHSYEFDNNNNWAEIEQFCRDLGGQATIWYATNIEIVDYVNAMRNLRIAVDESAVYNPSGLEIWFSDCGGSGKTERSVGPGATLRL